MKENFDDFAARIWDMVLPNGLKLRDATGADVMGGDLPGDAVELRQMRPSA